HGATEKVLEWNLRNIREQQLEHQDKSESYTYKLMDLARAYQACGMKAEARSTLEIAIARFESRQAERPHSKTEADKDSLGSALHFGHNHIEECQKLLISIAHNELALATDGEESRHTLTYWKESGQHIEMPYQDFDVAYRQGLCDLNKVARLKNYKDTENCLRKLAELCYCHCRFIEAENYYQQLLDLQTGHLQRGTTPELAEQTVLADLTELAGACRNQGEFSKAAEKFEQVLRMKKKLEGSNYPKMARDLNNLAGLYFLQGDFKRAKPLHEQSLALDQSRLGANHPAIAIYLKHLGQIHLELKEQQEDQKCFESAQTIDRKVAG
ncbi:MAG: tetratricopeptide repeat protein, partial [Candidatus Obscuribacterales bacterium]